MQTVAKAFIFDTAGNILLLHRSATHPSYAHQPDLPGGIVESGEAPAEGLAREIVEETGLAVAPEQLTLLGQTNQRKHSHDLLYSVTVAGEKPAVAISWEHEKPVWLPRGDIAHLTVPTNSDPYFTWALQTLLH